MRLRGRTRRSDFSLFENCISRGLYIHAGSEVRLRGRTRRSDFSLFDLCISRGLYIHVDRR